MLKCKDIAFESVMEGKLGIKSISKGDTNVKGYIDANEIVTEGTIETNNVITQRQNTKKIAKYTNLRIKVISTEEEYKIERSKVSMLENEVYEVEYKEGILNERSVIIESARLCETVKHKYNNVKEINGILLFDKEDIDYEMEFYTWYYSSKSNMSTVKEVEVYEDSMLKRYMIPNVSGSENIAGVREISVQPLPEKIYTRGVGNMKISVTINGIYNEEDEFLCKMAAREWCKLVTTNHTIRIRISFQRLANGILGSAGPVDFEYKNMRWYSTAGEIDLNTLYWNAGKTEVKTNNKTQAYYTLLHEMGHILGLGTLWIDHGLLNYGEWYEANWMNATYENALYIGSNGLTEYKKWISQNYPAIDITRIIGIPIEEDGGGGTAGGHIEEGDQNHRKRYFNGVYHPGLNTELMTGYSESGAGTEDMNNITVAMIKDLGYNIQNSGTMLQKRQVQWKKPKERKVDCKKTHACIC